MIKQIYFAKRNPSTTHGEFIENWQQHGELAASFSSIVSRFKGIAQCAQIEEAVDLDVDQELDGANILTYRDLLAAADLGQDPNIATMLVDELRVFSTYVSETTLTAVEDVIIDGPRGRLVLLEVVSRAEDVALPAFVSAWTGSFVRVLRSDPAFGDRVSRYVHNTAIFPAPAAYPYDGFAELWVDSVTDARTLIAASDRAFEASGTGAFEICKRFLFKATSVWDARPPKAP